MIKVSKNIQIPKEAKFWISKNIEVIKRLIDRKHYESNQLGVLDTIILPEKLKIKRKYNKEEVQVIFKIAPEELFIAKGWVNKKGEPFAGWADAFTNEIFLNSDKGVTKSPRLISFLIIHELVHILDPKLYREDLNIKPDAPYYEKPHEIDALLTEMSEMIRYKYSPEEILDMLRSGEIEKNPKRHEAIDNLSPEALRRFKINLYHDVIMDLEEKE